MSKGGVGMNFQYSQWKNKNENIKKWVKLSGGNDLQKLVPDWNEGSKDFPQTKNPFPLPWVRARQCLFTNTRQK